MATTLIVLWCVGSFPIALAAGRLLRGRSFDGRELEASPDVRASRPARPVNPVPVPLG